LERQLDDRRNRFAGVNVEQLARGQDGLVIGNDFDNVAARVERLEREHARRIGVLRVDDPPESCVAQPHGAVHQVAVGRVERVSLNRAQRGAGAGYADQLRRVLRRPDAARDRSLLLGHERRGGGKDQHRGDS
jgi:hypothetical protein